MSAIINEEIVETLTICLGCHKLVKAKITVHQVADEEAAWLKEEGIESPKAVTSEWVCPFCGNAHYS